MKLSNFRDSYYHYTDKASEVARKLAFAGIAIVWLFRMGDGVDSRLPRPLLLPVLLFAVALALDLLHYVYGGVAWGIFCRSKEKKGHRGDSDLDAPRWMNCPTHGFFYAKIVSVVVGYVMMIAFLWVLWRDAA